MAENKEKQEQITIEQLETYLWGAAVLLRGQIDAAGYKEYIFPLLFFKRLCDVHDEEYAAYLKEGGGSTEYAECQEYTINIPEHAHWNDVRNTTENIGSALVSAFLRIEQANPPVQARDGRMVGGLTGIFGKKDHWTNKNIMPDRIIRSLIEHFSRLSLTLAACPADEMGTGYEYLIGKFADDAGNTAQEFYTNRTVVELMAEILQPQAGESIYDPTCGSGGMLIKSILHVKERGQDWRSVKAFGQEFNALTASIARMNLFLHGVEEYSVANADTLQAPAFIRNGKLQTFDVVLANPPYSISEWNQTAFSTDKYGRNFLGTPPQGRADYAFIQHILKSMDPRTGRCAILLPHGILFRKEEAAIRTALVESDLVDCVIGLGPNLFFNSPMEACVLICRSQKPVARRGKILVINAVNEVTRKNANSRLEPHHIARIVEAYNNYADVPDFCKVLPKPEIKANGYDLSIQKYVFIVDKGEGFADVDLQQALMEWQTNGQAALNALGDLENILAEGKQADAPGLHLQLLPPVQRPLHLHLIPDHSVPIDQAVPAHDFLLDADRLPNRLRSERMREAPSGHRSLANSIPVLQHRRSIQRNHLLHDHRQLHPGRIHHNLPLHSHFHPSTVLDWKRPDSTAGRSPEEQKQWQEAFHRLFCMLTFIIYHLTEFGFELPEFHIIAGLHPEPSAIYFTALFTISWFHSPNALCRLVSATLEAKGYDLFRSDKIRMVSFFAHKSANTQ